MIDFENKAFLKMKENKKYEARVTKLIVPGEEVLGCYKSVRDGVVFTSMRIIIVNVQGMTGKKVDYTSIPYNKINVYSVETSGTLDLDAELTIFISGIGELKFEFKGKSDIIEISQYISQALIK